MRRICFLLFLALPLFAAESSRVFPINEGYVDSNGVFIYYKAFGKGDPLFIVHGGPGATHDYFLPHLIPLARTNRLIFIDERGSGRSERLENVKLYTVENMAEDVEAVRRALNLGKINLLGHSYGGVVVQAYAFKYQDNLRHLILASTFHSTKGLNEVFVKMKEKMPAELRARIEKMEKEGIFGKGYRSGRYTDEYMAAAWGEGYYPYTFRRRPDPSFEPVSPVYAWDLYREMWGEHGEFVVDGNLVSVEYADKLPKLKVPTLITVGDHDQVDPSMSREMQALIPGSKLVVLPESGHVTFVDQPEMFRRVIDDFVHDRK